MKLNELMDTIYPYKQISSNNKTVRFVFRSVDKSLYQVTLGILRFKKANRNGIKGDTILDVSFYRVKRDITLQKTYSAAVTNTGDSFRILSTVAHIVKTYVMKHKPNYIEFSSYDNEWNTETDSVVTTGRTKLYRALLNKILKDMPEYEIDREIPLINTTYFVIRLKDTKYGKLRAQDQLKAI